MIISFLSTAETPTGTFCQRAIDAENERLTKERDAIRLAFAEASHLAGPAFCAHDALRKAEADRDRLAARVAELEKVVEICAARFREYVNLHRSKNTSEGIHKAEVNQRLVAMCESARKQMEAL